MKKCVLIFLFLILLYNSFAQPVFYSGHLDPKIAIHMRLEIQSVYEIKNGVSYHSGYEFFGDYHFLKDFKKIRLEGKNNSIIPGKINSDSIIRLNEFIGLEQTGFFLGKFTKSRNFQGMWYSADSLTQHPFNLKVSQNASIVYKNYNSLIYPQLKDLKNRRVEKKINNILSELKSGVQVVEVVPDYFQREEYMFEIMCNQRNIFTYSWNQSIFEDSIYYGYLIHNTGGYQSYNLQTGQKIKYDDILNKGSEQYIDQLIVDGINEFCEFNAYNYNLDEIRNSLCVTQTGLPFPYRACSAVGKYDQDWAIEIPFSAIQFYINSSGLLKNLFPATALK
jgi:hypothetical protein